MERKHVRFLTVLVSLLLMVSLCATFVSAAEVNNGDPVCYVHGDVNNDGKIGTSDAIYVLYYSMLGDLYPDRYPVSQDCDFSGDAKVSTKDALYLLYASFGEGIQGTEQCPLNGVIHDFYDPFWTWNTEDYTATLTFRCGCGQTTVLTTGQEEGNIQITSATTEATCVAAGKTQYTAKVVYQGQEYTDTYTAVLPISGEGHVMVGTQGCETKSECQLCDYELAALGHSWVLNAEKSVAATCQSEAVQHYDCAVCAEEKTVTVEGRLSHTYQYVEGGDHLAEGATCTYVKTYRCSGCQNVVDGTAAADVYELHSYTATLTAEPNCSTAGVKTYACTVAGCDHSYAEEIPANGVHIWDNGTTADGVTTHSCTVEGCGATKTSVAVANDQAVSKEQLSNELQLENDTTVSLDAATVDALEQEVKISVSPADLSQTGLSEAQKAQVGDNTVYDFNMAYTDGTAITNFAGKVTVSLPYTLAEGEDIDSIDVWYIDDQGNLAQMTGTYSNGYVTFETDHFSYYTVTRLTPAQRCARYGHMEVSTEKAATCTEDGYSMKFCQRCGAELSKTVYKMLGHDYYDTSNAKAPTCTEPGVMEQSCGRCDHLVAAEIPALGHNMVMDEDRSHAADCENPGEVYHVCDREGCDYETKEEQIQQQHSFEKYAAEVVAPDCTNKGYTKQKCDLCQKEIISNEVAPLGHDFEVESWNWADDNSAAALKLVCKHNESHTKEQNAVVTVKTVAATCTGEGSVTYTATVAYNGKNYTDDIVVKEAAVGHKIAESWESNENNHYRSCTVCGEKIDLLAHEWAEPEYIKQPTCAEAGSAKLVCGICGYECTREVPATGEHDFVDGKCVNCGFEEVTCRHYANIEQEVDVSAYNFCTDIKVFVVGCECGYSQYFHWETEGMNQCKWGEETTTLKRLPDGTEQEVTAVSCTVCGLTKEYSGTYVGDINEETCLGYYKDYGKLSVNGQTIVETTWKMNSVSHPFCKTVETVDLSQYGMCGGELVTRQCACGERTFTYFEEGGCQWIYPQEGQFCEACKTHVITEQISSEEACCAYVDTVEGTFTRDGKELLSYTTKNVEDFINMMEISWKLLGESCTDGLELHFECDECGRVVDDYVEYHCDLTTITDLAGYGSCDTKLYQTACPCGENERYAFDFEKSHDWVQVSADEENAVYVDTCSVCNYTRTTTVVLNSDPDDCELKYTETSVYTDNKGHSYTGISKRVESNHDWQIKATMMGTSCLDGVEAMRICSKCNEISERATFYEHVSISSETYNLADYGLCRGAMMIHPCACGTEVWYEEDWNNRCNWQWVDGGYNMSVQYCPDCGVTRTESTEILADIDECHQRVRESYIFTKDDQELLKIVYETDRDNHRNVHSFVLNNPDAGCDGGYKITGTCVTCGHAEQWEHWGHENYVIAREMISKGQLCGNLELVTTTCPCGQNAWSGESWTNGHCDWRWDMEGQKDVCTVCGSERSMEWVNEDIEGETCKKKSSQKVTIVKNGETICEYEYETFAYDHSEVFAYELLGQTCDDGYTYSSYCADCGQVITERSPVQYGCNVRVQKEIPILNHEGVCSEIGLQEASCACGKEQRLWSYWDCDFDYCGWDEKEQCEIAECVKCGLVRYEKWNLDHIPGTCLANAHREYKFELNGEIIGTYQGTFRVADHNYETSFQLFGETCSDGYLVTEYCPNCGMTETYEERPGADGHPWYQIKRYDLADYGICGGWYEIHGCPCGEERSMGWDSYCNWEHLRYDDTTGEDVAYCRTCNTYRYEKSVGQKDPATCIYEGTYTVRLERDGQELLKIEYAERYESHEMLILEATLLNPNGNCEDGVHCVAQCVDCGMQGEWQTDYHEGMLIKKIDLPDGCGDIKIYSCACGLEKWWNREEGCQTTYDSWSETKEDGYVHYYSEEKCKSCGLIVEREYYYVPVPNSCEEQYINLYTYTYGGEVYEVDRSSLSYNHDTEYIGVSLKVPGTSCEDGVYIQWCCRKCGETGQYTTRNHEKVVVESIDLAAYGSYCGATLDHLVCACGARENYEFGHDTQCDVGEQKTEAWIADVIDNGQNTTEGWQNTYSYFYVLKCAVSDPVACGMTMRMATYWLKDDCMVTEYQNWQLGYDEATGTCQREITIPTGRKHAYHNYEESRVDETLADGSVRQGWQYTCPDCGSYYYDLYTYLNDVQIKDEELYVNTLYASNGEKRQRSNVWDYGLEANGYRYQTMHRYEYIRADGSVYWYQEDYTDYDFSNCTCSYVFMSSDGEYNSRVQSAHVNKYEGEYVKQETCSQFGQYNYYRTCQVCGFREQYSTDRYEPTCHYWQWDSDKQIFVCDTCGLESAVGSTGSICMEDMTEDADSVYTIGYWNRGEIEFTPVVSVILDDASTDDNELVITGIDFAYLTEEADGICALTFSKAAAQTEAEAALNRVGYTGSYAIRISFVPVTGEDTLDYAITFDSQMMAS